MPLPHLNDGDKVTAEDHWNPLVDDINAATSTVASLDNTTSGTASDVANLQSAVGTPYSSSNPLASRVGALESTLSGMGNILLARYDVSSLDVVTGGYVYLTFDVATRTVSEVTTSDNTTFTLAKAGLWYVSFTATTGGSASATGRFLGYISAGDYAAYASNDSTKAGGAFIVGPYGVPVISDGTQTCKIGIYPPADVTMVSQTFISMMYLGAVA